MTPRSLLPVADRPLILHPLIWLRDGGIRHLSVCANSDTNALFRALGTGREWDLSLEYYQDIMPRGPAGCIRDAARLGETSTVVVVEATTIPRLSLRDLLAAHYRSGSALTVVVSPLDHPQADGAPCLQPAGLYVFGEQALDMVPPCGYQDIKEGLIPRLHQHGHRVSTYTVDRSSTLRVHNAASYLAISKWAIERTTRQNLPPKGYVRQGEGWVHVSAEVDESVRMTGPVLIAEGARIGPQAVLVGPLAIGASCVVGESAVLCRSVLWKGCQVGHGAIVDHCVLTDGAKVSPGDRPPPSVRSADRFDLIASLRLWLDRRLHRRPGPRRSRNGAWAAARARSDAGPMLTGRSPEHAAPPELESTKKIHTLVQAGAGGHSS